ncbi:MAG: hypothetical protein INQ03_06260 [Candidatus Heimdallarchaeota archaeon]|nr:hypothetical protein [Candidatus Heimdallarchaeota archaeon]
MKVKKFLDIVTRKAKVQNNDKLSTIILIPFGLEPYYNILGQKNYKYIKDFYQLKGHLEEFQLSLSIDDFDILDLDTINEYIFSDQSNYIRSKLYGFELQNKYIILNDFTLFELYSKDERALSHLEFFNWRVSNQIEERWNNLINHHFKQVLLLEIYCSNISLPLLDYFENYYSIIQGKIELANIINSCFDNTNALKSVDSNFLQKFNFLFKIINLKIHYLIADIVGMIGPEDLKKEIYKLIHKEYPDYNIVNHYLGKEIWNKLLTCDFMIENFQNISDNYICLLHNFIPVINDENFIKSNLILEDDFNINFQKCKEMINQGKLDGPTLKYIFENYKNYSFSTNLLNLYKNISEDQLITSKLNAIIKSNRKTLFIIIDGYSYFQFLEQNLFDESKFEIEFAYSNLPTITKHFFNNCDIERGTDGITNISSFLGNDFKKIRDFALSTKKFYTIYDTMLDRIGRSKGSSLSNQAENLIDDCIKLIRKIESHSLEGIFDVVITADHGLIETENIISFNQNYFIKESGGAHHRYVISRNIFNEEIQFDADKFLFIDHNELIVGNRESEKWITPIERIGLGHKNDHFRSWHGGISLYECLVPLIIWRY